NSWFLISSPFRRRSRSEPATTMLHSFCSKQRMQGSSALMNDGLRPRGYAYRARYSCSRGETELHFPKIAYLTRWRLPGPKVRLFGSCVRDEASRGSTVLSLALASSSHSFIPDLLRDWRCLTCKLPTRSQRLKA